MERLRTDLNPKAAGWLETSPPHTDTLLEPTAIEIEVTT